MRRILIILFVLFSISGWSQTTYTSAYTQHWPSIFSTEIEQINRSISFEENSITLATENKAGKMIEIFYIRRINEKEDAIFYSCLTSHDQQVTIVKPMRMDLRIIDIFRASERTGEEIQLRLHLN